MCVWWEVSIRPAVWRLALRFHRACTPSRVHACLLNLAHRCAAAHLVACFPAHLLTWSGERKEFVLPAKFTKSPKFTEISPLLMGMLQSFDAVLNYADRDGDMVAIRDQDDLDLYLSELDATATLEFAISVEGDLSPYNTAY